MKKIITLAAIAISTMFMTGCAEKHINIAGVRPAAVSEAMSYETLAVIPIKNDTYGLANKLEQLLLDKKYDGDKIFDLASRNEIYQIMKEQSFNNSGAVKEGDKINLGEIDGVDAIIFSTINDASVKDSYFYKIRTRCADRECKQLVKVRVNCTKRDYSTSATFKMVDVETSKIIISKTYTEKTARRICEDESYSFENTATVLGRLQERMALRFVNLISPTEYYVEATIAEDEPNYDLTSDQEDKIEKANIAFENKFYDKAEKLYKEVIKETKGKSYVATYNLGLVYEQKGKSNEALALYKRCIDLVDDLSEVPELQESIHRVEVNQKSQKIVDEQVKLKIQK
jgi:tetratricopeptide (TPR) repeat protein